MTRQIKTGLLLLMLAAIVGSCSQSEELVDLSNNTVADNDDTYVVLRLQTNTSAATRSAEDSYNHVQGTQQEYAVYQARVYFYDHATKLFVKSVPLSGLKSAGSDSQGNIVYEADRVPVAQGTYDIFVTANTDRVINKANEAAFLANIDSLTYVRGLVSDISKGVVMTNRASDNTATVIMNTDQSEETVVGITLERVLARLDIGKGAQTFELTDDNSRKYASVTLDGYHIVNLAKYYYMYRHTAVLNSMEVPAWSINQHFGSINDVDGYVIDPYFFSKQIDASGFTNADKYYENYFGDYNNPAAIAWTAFKTPAATPQYNTTYCLENCMLMPAQKHGYSTGVIFRATVEPNNNVYHLAANGSLELASSAQSYPEVLYYMNYKFYDSAAALAAAVGANSVTDADLETYKARKFEKTDDGYHCYYYYWVRHQDNLKPNIMGVMEFGIVRNNIYRLLITNVSGLGSHTIDTDPDIADEGETYLKVMLNVKPWIVRDQTNIVL